MKCVKEFPVLLRAKQTGSQEKIMKCCFSKTLLWVFRVAHPNLILEVRWSSILYLPCTIFDLMKVHVSISYRPKAIMINWAPSSEFVSSSNPSWQILTAHAQPFRGARDLAFCLKVPLDSLLVWASSEGSGETARMRRLAWTFAARIGYKYQIRLTRSSYSDNENWL